MLLTSQAGGAVVAALQDAVSDLLRLSSAGPASASATPPTTTQRSFSRAASAPIRTARLRVLSRAGSAGIGRPLMGRAGLGNDPSSAPSPAPPPAVVPLLCVEAMRLLCLVPSFVATVTGPHSSGMFR